MWREHILYFIVSNRRADSAETYCVCFINNFTLSYLLFYYLSFKLDHFETFYSRERNLERSAESIFCKPAFEARYKQLNSDRREIREKPLSDWQ